ncbi:MAG: Dabb family protein [Desulfobacterales bacterium]|jgi:quinol monooxygenase YgiN|nr:Dabb family protein [Desulfobacteraceae bacterium]MDY0310580.1 Dabb family protein [Desulfobacterales bacterium]
MLHHVVLMKFKPGVRDGLVDELEAALDDLPNRIVQIQTYEFGRDVLHGERSWDFALVSGFANLTAMQIYQNHPDHQAVVARLREICAQIVSVDFESKPLPIIERDPTLMR